MRKDGWCAHGDSPPLQCPLPLPTLPLPTHGCRGKGQPEGQIADDEDEAGMMDRMLMSERSLTCESPAPP